MTAAEEVWKLGSKNRFLNVVNVPPSIGVVLIVTKIDTTFGLKNIAVWSSGRFILYFS